MTDLVPPIITLLTDFGAADSYVAEVRGALLRAAPTLTLVDVSHEVPPGDVRAAQYLLGRTWRSFPAGTVHLAVVDPGVGSARRALAARAEGHGFVAPDNGLLTPVLAEAEVVELPIPATAAVTFHGRDLFAPAAVRLALGEALERLGMPVADAQRSPLPAARSEAGRVTGEVLHIDRFGTLVTNIPSRWVEAHARVAVGAGHRAPVARTFSDVEPGALVAFVGSGGTLEIAARDHSAARITGARRGSEVRLEPS